MILSSARYTTVVIACLMASPSAAVDFTGVWASDLRFHTIGFPLITRNTEWDVLSDGRPEDRKAPSFDEMAAPWVELVEQGQDLVAYAMSHPYQPPYTEAGNRASEAIGNAMASMSERHPSEGCYPRNVIGISQYGIGLEGPVQIIQAEDRIAILFEDGMFRTIFLDGRGHLDSLPSWTGHSVGDWEGDSLVVETVNFKGESAGFWPMSSEAEATETFSLSDDGQLLTVKLIYEDPVYLVEPVGRMIYMDLQPDHELVEATCLESVRGIAEYDELIRAEE